MKPGSEVTSRAGARIAAIACAVIASTGATAGSRADADRAQTIVSVQTSVVTANLLFGARPGRSMSIGLLAVAQADEYHR